VAEAVAQAVAAATAAPAAAAVQAAVVAEEDKTRAMTIVSYKRLPLQLICKVVFALSR
jgi:hypothetical protein